MRLSKRKQQRELHLDRDVGGQHRQLRPAQHFATEHHSVEAGDLLKLIDKALGRGRMRGEVDGDRAEHLRGKRGRRQRAAAVVCPDRGREPHAMRAAALSELDGDARAALRFVHETGESIKRRDERALCVHGACHLAQKSCYSGESGIRQRTGW